MDKAKITTIFVLIGVLIMIMVFYWNIAKGNETLIGGFIATTTYLVKKLADEIEEVIDILWGVKTKNEKQTGDIK